MAQHLGGALQVRQLMGHTQFGARVVYGDCIFFTISPNEQMSALVLRLSRYRQSDPYVKHGSAHVKNLAKQSYPEVEAKRRRTVLSRPGDTDTKAPDGAEEDVFVELPQYDVRAAATARDPLAVIEGYRLEVFLRLAALLGVRMCPNCPRCNDSVNGCQDLFGSNMRPAGGVLGGMSAFGGGTEHQMHGTPHLHAEGHIVCAYQYGTLKEVAAKIEQGLISLQSCVDYNSHLHESDLLDSDMHAEFVDRVEEEKAKSFAGAEHDAMCTTPAYLAEDALGQGHRATLAEAYEQPDLLEQLVEDGGVFRTEYLRDAQYVFSRVQHHVHRRTKDGTYMPLHNCAKKTKKKGKSSVCKHEFPMTKLCIESPVVVCRGLAKKLALRVSGRRNAIGKVMGKRRCRWQSGTTRAFAVLFRSNSHTAPNFRVPLSAATHDDQACPSRTCREWATDPTNWKVLSK
ncbi:MAG TPA: hypothetical protein EYP98_01630, partial [Planctomycetes bacterium]|nr:hypothetical protein [Planctomycetota bacterium]